MFSDHRQQTLSHVLSCTHLSASSVISGALNPKRQEDEVSKRCARGLKGSCLLDPQWLSTWQATNSLKLHCILQKVKNMKNFDWETKNNCLLPCRWLDTGLPWERIWELSPLAWEVKENNNSFSPFLLLQCFFAISAWVNLTSSIQHRCLSDSVILHLGQNLTSRKGAYT